MVSQTDAAVNALLWLVTEPCASVIAACLPTYRALFRSGGGLESVIRSVRSLTSIRSWNSREIRGSKDRRNSTSSENPVIPLGSKDTVDGWPHDGTTTNISAWGEEHEVERPSRIGAKTDIGRRVTRATGDRL